MSNIYMCPKGHDVKKKKSVVEGKVVRSKHVYHCEECNKDFIKQWLVHKPRVYADNKDDEVLILVDELNEELISMLNLHPDEIQAIKKIWESK